MWTNLPRSVTKLIVPLIFCRLFWLFVYYLLQWRRLCDCSHLFFCLFIISQKVECRCCWIFRVIRHWTNLEARWFRVFLPQGSGPLGDIFWTHAYARTVWLRVTIFGIGIDLREGHVLTGWQHPNQRVRVLSSQRKFTPLIDDSSWHHLMQSCQVLAW